MNRRAWSAVFASTLLVAGVLAGCGAPQRPQAATARTASACAADSSVAASTCQAYASASGAQVEAAYDSTAGQVAVWQRRTLAASPWAGHPATLYVVVCHLYLPHSEFLIPHPPQDPTVYDTESVVIAPSTGDAIVFQAGNHSKLAPSRP